MKKLFNTSNISIPNKKLAVLGLIKNFTAIQQDWWDEISKEQQDAIDASLAEMKAGNLLPHEEVMKNYSKINHLS